MKTEALFLQEIETIFNQRHFIDSNNDKDVGDYFESCLGKKIDNKKQPDISYLDVEIKTSSKKHLATTFTRSPDKYGYTDDNGVLRLMTTVTVNTNNLGFRLVVDNRKIHLMHDDIKVQCWNRSDIYKDFCGKMPHLAFVTYRKKDNEVLFDSFVFYKNSKSKKLVELIKNNMVSVDIRLREGYSHEKISMKDRGTAFRLKNIEHYDFLFEEKTIIVQKVPND